MNYGEKDNFYKNPGISANWSEKIGRILMDLSNVVIFCVILPFPNHTKLVINWPLNQNGQWLLLRVSNWCRAWDQTPPQPPFRGAPGQAGTLLPAGHLLRFGQHCSSSFLSAHAGQASLGSLSVPPDQLPGRERGSSSACPRATSQSSALLVRQDAQGLLLLPLQEEIFLPPKYVSHQSLGSC